MLRRQDIVSEKNIGETEGQISFTLAGAFAGARRCVPIAISGCGIGLVFGTLAGQAGLGAGEAVLMSALVFSGAAQFVVLGLWAAPLPVATIVFATLVVGLRHVLMGAVLAPVFSKLPRLKAYGSVFFMADENWALTIGEFEGGRRDAAFLVGGGLLMFVAWTGSTFAGGALRGVVENPPLDGRGRGRGGSPPVAARPVVHPARWSGGELRRGCTSWPLIPAPCSRSS